MPQIPARRVSARVPTIDGTTSRFGLIVVALASVTVLAWHGTVDGQAYVAVVTFLLGGIVHASGTNQGSQASVDPPTS